LICGFETAVIIGAADTAVVNVHVAICADAPHHAVVVTNR
jgi:hypothetical protein